MVDVRVARTKGALLVLGLTLGLGAGCSTLDDGAIGQGSSTTGTTVAQTTVPPTTVPPTTVAPTTTAVLGSTQTRDGSLPRTGPSEAAVLAAVGCSLVVAGRFLLDGLRWLDHTHLNRSMSKKPPIAPR